jgi:hypothetical protein
MTRNPWELGFYSRQRSVQTPLAPLEEVIAAARHFGVTHLVPDGERPALWPWLAGRIPGLRAVHAEGGLRLYEIRYDELPPPLREVPPLPEWRRTHPAPPNPILPPGAGRRSSARIRSSTRRHCA